MSLHGKVLLALTVALLGCNAGDQILRLGREGTPPPAKARLWTLWDIQSALVEGRKVAPTDSFPDGFDPNFFLTAKGAGEQELRVIPAFAEGEPAAYVSAEVWVNFEEVWAQPWYVQLTAWNDKAPTMNRLRYPDDDGDPMTAAPSAPPIWDVGPDSLFYSPLWLYIYVVVPKDATAETYKSSEELFEDGLQTHWSGGWTFSARPRNIVGEAMPTMGREQQVHPIMGTPIGNLRMGDKSWVDKKDYAYFDQGANNFKFDPKTLVVEEVPQFILAKRNGAGRPVGMGAPNIMGVGPLFSRRPAEVVGGRPRFGAYSRLYHAIVGANAMAFDPELFPMAAQALTDKMLNPKAYTGRVASNAVTDPVALTGGCFNSPMFPMGCQWLDSQARVEELGAQNIERTEVSMSSALVFYAGKGIGR